MPLITIRIDAETPEDAVRLIGQASDIISFKNEFPDGARVLVDKDNVPTGAMRVTP